MIPKIEVYMHDDSIGFPRCFEIDAIDYIEDTFVIVDAFGNPNEYSATDRLFRCEGKLFRTEGDE